MGKVIILDFGSQYTQLIARRVRELNIYCEIYPFNRDLTKFTEVKAIILSGSPSSVNDDTRLDINLDKLLLIAPVLAICYGAQYIASCLGGKVARSEKREYGKATLQTRKSNRLLKDLALDSQVWMSHADTILELNDDFEVIASTENIPIAAFELKKRNHSIFGIQFHPEVTHTLEGAKILSNFLIDIAGCSANWNPKSFIDQTIAEIKQKIGKEKVLLGISGGVDSTVAAVLINKSIGSQLTSFFINNGLLRKNEYEEVLASYKQLGLNVIGIDASARFIKALAGVTDPEGKRKIIGKTFVDVFIEEAEKLRDVKWFAQGTIYPDVIESVSVNGPSATIKSHHNVGGLPDYLKLGILEPLRMLFKDEVRKIGNALGLEDDFIGRHPFPGPGLSIRILGELTHEKIDLCQEADHIFISQLKKNGWYDKVWQAGAILLPVKSVGVMGDERTYEYTCALRAVNSSDGMTAEWSKVPMELLADISNEIINNVKGINRVVYDISTKPPATIEWE